MSDESQNPRTVLLRVGGGRNGISPHLEAQAKPARLVRIDPSTEERPDLVMEISLGMKAVTIGRDDSSDIAIDLYGVSRRHARVYPDSGLWFVEDRGSTNGVWANGIRVDAPRSLQDGDKLFIGKACFLFQQTDPGSAKPAELEPGDATGEIKNPRLQSRDAQSSDGTTVPDASIDSANPDNEQQAETPAHDIAELVRAHAAPHREAIVAQLVAKAREGDVQAIALVLEYLSRQSS